MTDERTEMTQMDVTEAERDLLMVLRDRTAEIRDLSAQSEVERREWEQAHPGEFYSALSQEGSSGGKAYALCAETCAEFAAAAFDLAARELGITGWQGSYAELEFLRRSRRIEGPFGLYQVSDALYPQYDVLERVRKVLDSDDTKRWLGDEAERLLSEKATVAAPQVVAHWEMLVAQRDALGADA